MASKRKAVKMLISVAMLRGYLENILPPKGVPGPKKFENHWYIVQGIGFEVMFWLSVKKTDLTKVSCFPYIQGLSVRLGYSPKGGTTRVKTREIRTKLAGRTIWREKSHQSQHCNP